MEKKKTSKKPVIRLQTGLSFEEVIFLALQTPLKKEKRKPIAEKKQKNSGE
jgi:hypothetical protein